MLRDNLRYGFIPIFRLRQIEKQQPEESEQRSGEKDGNGDDLSQHGVTPVGVGELSKKT